MTLLSERECRRRLGTVGVGRLGFTEGALPVIEPMPFTLNRKDEVVVQVGEGGGGIAGGTIVAFETDDWDPSTRSGWSVSAVGPCRPVEDPAELADLERVSFAWATPRTGRYLAVRLAFLRGWEVRPEGRDLAEVPAGQR